MYDLVNHLNQHSQLNLNLHWIRFLGHGTCHQENHHHILFFANSNIVFHIQTFLLWSNPQYKPVRLHFYSILYLIWEIFVAQVFDLVHSSLLQYIDYFYWHNNVFAKQWYFDRQVIQLLNCFLPHYKILQLFRFSDKLSLIDN